MCVQRARTKVNSTQKRWLWLGCPLVSLILGMLLLFDAGAMPPSTPIGHVIGSHFSCVLRAVDLTSTTVVAEAVGNDEKPSAYRFSVVTIGPESTDTLMDSLWDKDHPMAMLSGRVTHEAVGFWSVLAQRSVGNLSLIPMAAAWTPQMSTQVEKALVSKPETIQNAAALPSSIQASLALLRSPEPMRVYWPGVANDMLVVALMVLLGLSLVRVPGWCAAYLHNTQRSRLERGVCPVCGYSLKGLTHSVCPECGQAFETETTTG